MEREVLIERLKKIYNLLEEGLEEWIEDWMYNIDSKYI